MPGVTTDQARESRLRRIAWGQRLGLAKSPRRYPGAEDYGMYTLYDLSTLAVVHSSPMSPFCFDLDDVEDYLTGGPRRPVTS